MKGGEEEEEEKKENKKKKEKLSTSGMGTILIRPIWSVQLPSVTLLAEATATKITDSKNKPILFFFDSEKKSQKIYHLRRSVLSFWNGQITEPFIGGNATGTWHFVVTCVARFLLKKRSFFILSFL
jgi:hypothetical protein